MARKSRKNTESLIESKQVKTDRIRAAGYARNSIDKGEDRNTVDTQLMLIKQYVDKHPEYELVDSFADIGYSGTDFNRPEFMRLIDEVKSGNIQCIIVKDLSRFGRNYIETGYYIETILPRLNAKLLSINDNFDSSNEDDCQRLEIPIKNMINEYYAKESSKKYTDAFKLHSRLGDTKRGLAPYGYLVDRSNYQLIEDEQTSPIVQVIYHWFLKGASQNCIADRLNALGIVPPGIYKYLTQGVKTKKKGDQWSGSNLAEILFNPTYVGDTFQGRSRARKYCNDFVRRVDKSEWIVHENTHIPLITHEDYEEADKRTTQHREKRHRTIAENIKNRGTMTNYFSGKVYCAECGRVMSFNKYQHGSANDGYDESYYICDYDPIIHCGKRAYTDFLCIVVMDQIKVLVETMCDQKVIAEKLLNGEDKDYYCLSEEKKIVALEKKKYDCENAIERLYLDLTDEVIDAEDYKMLLTHYSAEKEKATSEIKQQKAALLKKKKVLERYDEILTHFSSAIESQTIDESLVDELIERITVSDGNRFEIDFKVKDEMEEALKVIGESAL